MEDNYDLDNFLMLDSDKLDEFLMEGRTEDQIMALEDNELEAAIKFDEKAFNKEVQNLISAKPELAKDMKQMKKMIEEKMLSRGGNGYDEEILYDLARFELEDVSELEDEKYRNVDIRQEDDEEDEDDEDYEDEEDYKEDSVDDEELNVDTEDESVDDEERNPFSMIFVNEEDLDNVENEIIYSASPVEGNLNMKPHKYEQIFNGDMISSKKGLDDLHFKKLDFSSGEEVENLSFGFEPDDDEDGDDKEDEKEDDEDDEDGLENENPFHPDNLFDMGQYEDADVDRYKKMITDLRNPESGPMFIYMGACWMGGALAGTYKGFKKSLFRTPKKGWDRIFECFEYSKPIIERSSNLALRVGAVIGVSQLGLSFFHETNEYTRITSFGLGMLVYYKSFHHHLISKTKMLTFFGLFSACCIGMHQLRRTFNGYHGSEPLISFLSLTTHNPFIRYLLDVKLGITDFFFPNFYGDFDNFNLTSPFDLPVTTSQIQMLDATPKLREDL